MDIEATTHEGAAATADRLDRVRFITRNYELLQGLRGVVVGAAFLAFWLGLGTLDGFAGLAVSVAAVVIGLVLYRAADRWYARRLGQVCSSRTVWDFGPDGSPTWSKVTAAVVGLAGFALDIVFTSLPVSGMLIGMGLAIAVLAWSVRRFRPYWPWVGMVIAVLGALPAVVGPAVDAVQALDGDDDVFGAKLGLAALTVAVMSVVQGAADHVVLVRELRTDADSAAGEEANA